MPQIFPVYKLGQDTPGALLLPGAEELFPYSPAPERNADHWLLGPDASSLTPYGGTATLTAQGSDHEWGTNYVTSPSYANALITNISDASVQTIYTVVRYQPNSGKNTLLLGNLSAALQGSGIWLNSDGNISTIIRTASNSPALVNYGIPVGVSAGDFIFLGLSIRQESEVAVTRTIIGNSVYDFTWNQPKVISIPNKIMIGNAYISGSIYTPAPVDVAELIVRGTVADTAGEMLRVYGRSRVRMAARGLDLR